MGAESITRYNLRSRKSATFHSFNISKHHHQLEDDDYKELDPTTIRLPPPIPPSDRLLRAVEAFYLPPSHERPRNQ